MLKRILVVDDDPQVLELFTRILTNGGYSVTSERSGAAANDALARQAFDLVILDLSMPGGIDGFEVLKSIRAHRPKLPVLVISGYMQGPLLRASELVGATSSLSKADAAENLLP